MFKFLFGLFFGKPESGVEPPRPPRTESIVEAPEGWIKKTEAKGEVLYQSPPVSRSTSTVLIGFDFGTHSTKVVCRERKRSGMDANIVVFDRPSPGYPLTASPSLVCVDRGKLYFGSEALTRKSGKVYHSLKVELIPGMRRPRSEFPEGLDSKLLIAAYLAWAFQRVNENLGEFQDAKKLLNISAPMDHFKSEELCKSYLSILQAAWNLGFEEFESTPIEQGIESHALRSIIEPLLAAPLDSESMRPYGVMPETIAPIISASLNPLSKPGMYAVIDMGAATTEVSIFHIGERGYDQKVLCYQDTTKLIGGNDLNSKTNRVKAVEEVIQKVKKQFTEAWFKGFQVDFYNHVAKQRWRQLSILISGGGTLHPEVRAFLDEFNPKAFWEAQGDLVGPVERERHLPASLSVASGTSEELSLYAVANGLAIDEKRWPIIYKDIDPLPPQAPEGKPDTYWGE